MKYITTFLFCLCIYGCNTGNHYKNDLEKNHLKGKVRELMETNYERIGHKITTGDKIMYNKAGDAVINIMRDLRTGFFIDFSVKYDEKGREIEEDFFDTNKVFTGKTMLHYNNDCNEVENDSYDKNGNYTGKVISKFNADGKKIVEISYNARDSIEGKTEYQYQDRIVEMDIYTINNKLDSKVVTKYDEKGNKIEMDMYGSSSKDQYIQYEYKYGKIDENGNWTKRITLFQGDTLEGTMRKITYYP